MVCSAFRKNAAEVSPERQYRLAPMKVSSGSRLGGFYFSAICHITAGREAGALPDEDCGIICANDSEFSEANNDKLEEIHERY